MQASGYAYMEDHKSVQVSSIWSWLLVNNQLEGVHSINMLHASPGEVVCKNLGRYVPPRLLKTGSLELIFGLKLGSPEQKFTKICVSGAKN